MNKSALSLCLWAAITVPTANAVDCVPVSAAAPITVENSCAFPFPNKHYWMKNGYVQVPRGVISNNITDQFNNGHGRVLPQELMSNFDGTVSSGFSAGTPVIFRFSKQKYPDLNNSHFGTDGRGSIPVFASSSSYTSLNITVNVDQWASNKSKKYHYVQVLPETRWPYDDEVTIRVGAQKNSPVYQQTKFTVRTKHSVVFPLKRRVEEVAANVKVSHIKIDEGISGLPSVKGVDHIRTGKITMYDARDKRGLFGYKNAKLKKVDIPFILTIPTKARYQPAAVAIYAHGLAAAKRSAFFDVVKSNAANNVATIAINHPNHFDGIPFSYLNRNHYLNDIEPDKLGRTIGLFPQAVINTSALLAALKLKAIHPNASKDTFRTLNHTEAYCAGRMVFGKWCLGKKKNPRDLNTDKVLIQGTSLGGIVGAAYASLAPHQVRGAVLQVAGTGMVRILSESKVWNKLFKKLVPSVATADEAILIRAMVQHTMDYADPINYVERLSQTNTPVYMMAGANDDIVPNKATLAMAKQLKAVYHKNWWTKNLFDYVTPYDKVKTSVFRGFPPLGNPHGILSKLESRFASSQSHSAFMRLDNKSLRAKFMKEHILGDKPPR